MTESDTNKLNGLVSDYGLAKVVEQLSTVAFKLGETATDEVEGNTYFNVASALRYIEQQLSIEIG